jgi:hypothetical protein
MPTFRLPVHVAHTVLGPDGGVNVWHFRTVSDNTLLTEQFNAAVASIRKFYESCAGLGTTPRAVLNNGTTITADAAQQVGTDTVKTVTWAALTVPDSAATAPPSLCLTVNWLTSSASRRGRGRTMIGPLSTSAIQSNGTPSAAVLAALRSNATDLATRNLADNGWAVGVYGLQNAGGASTAPHEIRDITAAKVNNHFTWLRSRGN